MNVDDEIIREVRRIRKAHAEQHGHDLRRIFEDLKAQERESGRKLVELPPRRVHSNQRVVLGS